MAGATIPVRAGRGQTRLVGLQAETQACWKRDPQNLLRGARASTENSGPLLLGTSHPKVVPRLDHHMALGLQPSDPAGFCLASAWCGGQNDPQRPQSRD